VKKGFYGPDYATVAEDSFELKSSEHQQKPEDALHSLYLPRSRAFQKNSAVIKPLPLRKASCARWKDDSYYTACYQDEILRKQNLLEKNLTFH
jgi:hypothetical protein